MLILDNILGLICALELCPSYIGICIDIAI